jgi:hypothetical protein
LITVVSLPVLITMYKTSLKRKEAKAL